MRARILLLALCIPAALVWAQSGPTALLPEPMADVELAGASLRK